MIVKSSIVEADQLQFEQRFDIFGLRIDHLDDRIRALELPTNDKQIRIYFDIEEYQSLVIYYRFRLSRRVIALLNILRPPAHPLDYLQGSACLMARIAGEADDLGLQIGHIICHAR